jgi:hypothetical protein
MIPQTTTIHVEWNSRIGGGFTAIAAENKDGYEKGEEILNVPFQMKKFPKELCIIKKQPHDSI